MRGPLVRPGAKLQARFAAALLAVALSGLPRVALGLLPQAPHHCLCQSHGAEHRCICPVCGEAARRARQSSLASLPPCHRALAEKALQEDEQRESEPRAPECGPPCGEDAAAVAPVAGSDHPFLPAKSARVAQPPRAERRETAAAPVQTRPAVPELPPPRAA